MAGNRATRSWLRPSARYDSTSTTPLALSTPATSSAGTPLRSMVATTALRWLGVGHERNGEVPPFGPGVDDLRRLVAASRSPFQAAVAVDPLHLVDRQEQGGQRRGVVGLVLAGAAEGQAQVQKRWDPPTGGGDPLDPVHRGGRAAGQPQPAVGGQALLGGEVVHVGLAGVEAQPAGGRGRIHQHEAAGGRAVQLHRHPRWRSRCGSGRRHRPAGRLTGWGWVPGSDSMITGASRWGAAATAAANLAENAPKLRCWLRVSIRPNTAASQNPVVPPLPSTTS